ncbi:Uncharacterised protein [Vibrio cholerae]|uniref:Uncharacterized protein n=1 Tax=Vibrio cholerae TaxID=666 RepID=A0A655Y6F6_VIBCL|nr:Uncharacterised protein [Vibrio cholerae]CSB96774.1 Uncharacterised protein [Vibrio cholerae]CSC30256.1 Uncharacterised protein [Vibrio cholerae]CSC47566.1 Uncharacterised protein [Vibrio cholerae]CSC58067.1 Uncharacterised protein [Vibrio cholerae]
MPYMAGILSRWAAFSYQNKASFKLLRSASLAKNKMVGMCPDSALNNLSLRSCSRLRSNALRYASSLALRSSSNRLRLTDSTIIQTKIRISVSPVAPIAIPIIFIVSLTRSLPLPAQFEGWQN